MPSSGKAVKYSKRTDNGRNSMRQAVCEETGSSATKLLNIRKQPKNETTKQRPVETPNLMYLHLWFI